MDKWNYIERISEISDQYGNKLIVMMEKYNKLNLCEITYEEAQQYYEYLKETKDYEGK